MIKSPLRYPGGKSKAIKFLLKHIPQDFSEFREIFVGGGSVFISLKQLVSNKTIFKINDLNFDLICFWENVKSHNLELVEEIRRIKKITTDGRELFYSYKQENVKYSNFERAVRFFILNRISFSGTVDSGGYSKQAFEKRFTDSSIDRLSCLERVLKNVKITHNDYENHLFEKGENVFIFLDPPYYSATKSKLYGKKGDLHTSFNHERFSENMKKCNHKWLITYDNSPEIRELFDFAFIYEWELQYGMNNYKKAKAEIGKEVLITNYKLDYHQIKKKQLELKF